MFWPGVSATRSLSTGLYPSKSGFCSLWRLYELLVVSGRALCENFSHASEKSHFARPMPKLSQEGVLDVKRHSVMMQPEICHRKLSSDCSSRLYFVATVTFISKSSFGIVTTFKRKFYMTKMAWYSPFVLKVPLSASWLIHDKTGDCFCA